MLSWIGLCLIIIAWSFQIYLLFKNKNEKTISPVFAVLQALGIFFIIVETYSSDPVLAGLNGLSCLGAIIVLIMVIKKK
ncbi:hypothetical protein KO465_03855 [Candidatus Micrarchaeota archaeon]|nr:hypothetical protein [Candidatus Micrarchaeota archaeon]